MKRWLVALLCCWGLAPSPCLAQEPGSEEKAIRLYEEAEAYYKLQNWAKALSLYEAAYLLSPQPELLFNIGQCYRQLGKYDEALRSYKTFLREVPNDPSREEIEGLIKATEKLRAASQPATQVTSAPLSLPVEAPAAVVLGPRWPLFVSSSGAALGLLVGGPTLSSRIDAESAAISGDASRFALASARAQGLGLGADVSMLVGLGAGVYSSFTAPRRRGHPLLYSISGVSAASALACGVIGVSSARSANAQGDSVTARQLSARAGAFSGAADALWISAALWAGVGLLSQHRHSKESPNSAQLSTTF